jgi:DNA-binding IscR family transcriptional regulator
VARWNIEAKDADTFVLDQITLDKSRVYSRVQQIADSRHNPPTTMGDVLAKLENSGLLESVATLRV